MKGAIALIAFSALPAHAADFPARVAKGNEVAATPEGRRYETSLAPAIQAAMMACIPRGSPLTDGFEAFTLVGDVDRSGRLQSVEIRPSTVLSRCFAGKFASAPLPTPPTTERLGDTYPLTVEMSIEE